MKMYSDEIQIVLIMPNKKKKEGRKKENTQEFFFFFFFFEIEERGTKIKIAKYIKKIVKIVVRKNQQETNVNLNDKRKKKQKKI